MRVRSVLVPPAIVLLASSACAIKPQLITPEVPVELKPPAGQVLGLAANGSGVQIYECIAKQDASYSWNFKAPEATLTDHAGRTLGKHYAGPTWEANDGSTVVGEVKARTPGPSPTAIPWLLVIAKSNAGSGVFSSVTSIQRLETAGGLQPAEPCTSINLGKTVRVPYTARYYFYHASR